MHITNNTSRNLTLCFGVSSTTEKPENTIKLDSGEDFEIKNEVRFMAIEEF